MTKKLNWEKRSTYAIQNCYSLKVAACLSHHKVFIDELNEEEAKFFLLAMAKKAFIKKKSALEKNIIHQTKKFPEDLQLFEYCLAPMGLLIGTDEFNLMRDRRAWYYLNNSEKEIAEFTAPAMIDELSKEDKVTLDKNQANKESTSKVYDTYMETIKKFLREAAKKQDYQMREIGAVSKLEVRNLFNPIEELKKQEDVKEFWDGINAILPMPKCFVAIAPEVQEKFEVEEIDCAANLETTTLGQNTKESLLANIPEEESPYATLIKRIIKDDRISDDEGKSLLELVLLWSIAKKADIFELIIIFQEFSHLFPVNCGTEKPDSNWMQDLLIYLSLVSTTDNEPEGEFEFKKTLQPAELMFEIANHIDKKQVVQDYLEKIPLIQERSENPYDWINDGKTGVSLQFCIETILIALRDIAYEIEKDDKRINYNFVAIKSHNLMLEFCFRAFPNVLRYQKIDEKEIVEKFTNLIAGTLNTCTCTSFYRDRENDLMLAFYSPGVGYAMPVEDVAQREKNVYVCNKRLEKIMTTLDYALKHIFWLLEKPMIWQICDKDVLMDTIVAAVEIIDKWIAIIYPYDRSLKVSIERLDDLCWYLRKCLEQRGAIERMIPKKSKQRCGKVFNLLEKAWDKLRRILYVRC